MERLINNPAIIMARSFQAEVAAKGGCSRLIGNGGPDVDLTQIFSQSLLGRKLPGVCIEEDLTPYERSLLGKDSLKILTIIDLDGVMYSPIHAIFQFLRKPSHRLGKVGIGQWRWLLKVTSASDQAVLWTSRLSLFDNNYFPFMSRYTKERIEKLGQGKLTVRTGKPLLGSNQVLEEMLKSQSWDITYFVGSGYFDRSQILSLIENNPDLAPKIVFFDTGHLFL